MTPTALASAPYTWVCRAQRIRFAAGPLAPAFRDRLLELETEQGGERRDPKRGGGRKLTLEVSLRGWRPDVSDAGVRSGHDRSSPQDARRKQRTL